MHIYVYSMYVFMDACMYVYSYCIYVCLYVCMYVRMFVLYICMYVCMYVRHIEWKRIYHISLQPYRSFQLELSPSFLVLQKVFPPYGLSCKHVCMYVCIT